MKHVPEPKLSRSEGNLVFGLPLGVFCAFLSSTSEQIVSNAVSCVSSTLKPIGLKLAVGGRVVRVSPFKFGL